MKKYKLLFPILILLLSACSNRVYVQKDDATNLSAYKTYMWVVTQDNEDDKKARKTSFADIGVHNAVNKELSKAGWRETKDNPDVLVSYDILVERNVNKRTQPVYTRPMTRTYFNPYSRRFRTVVFPSRFLGYQTYQEPVREATITINMMDAKTDRPVWQAWTTQNLNARRISADEITGGVKNIFKKFKGG